MKITIASLSYNHDFKLKCDELGVNFINLNHNCENNNPISLSAYLRLNEISKNYKHFIISFLILFLLSPITYAYVSIKETNKRTDYPGKQIAKKVQMTWDKEFKEPINVVLGNEWNAGNLSYHLKTRPVWDGEVDQNKLDTYNIYICIDSICLGNR